MSVLLQDTQNNARNLQFSLERKKTQSAKSQNQEVMIMPNLSQKKRQRMLDFLGILKKEHTDDESIRAFTEIENLLRDKKYGLVWEEHSERVDKMLEENIPILTEDSDKKISTSTKSIYNFILEGDNLQSLYLLEKTHRGTIDLIYIDPPYNTGSNDFIYDDNFVDEQDAYRHSKWLSFMKERLSIARELLSLRGVIFIQISDIELANLKCLCDEIFEERNYLNIISVNMKNIAGASGGGEDKRFKKNCEYILVYARDYSMMPIFNGSYTYTEMNSVVEQYRKEGKTWHYTSVIVEKGDKEYVGSTVDGDGNEIKIYRRKNAVIKSVKQIMKEENLSEKDVYYKYGQSIFEAKDAQSSIRSRVIQAKKKLGITDDVVSIEYVPKTGKRRGTLYEQFYKGEKCRLFAWLADISEVIDGILYKKSLQGTYWDYTSKINNLTKEGAVEFSNGKKPVDLIKQIIKLYPDSNITILDFFAGSATTGHATIALNQEDQGTRQFILCSNNESNICEEKTYTRIRNVIHGYGKTAGIPANLKYFRCDWTPRKPEDYLLSNALCLHIREMIELQQGIEIDNVHNVLILNKADFRKYVMDNDIYDQIECIWVNQNIIFNSEEMTVLNTLGFKYIPREFFGHELREAAE